MMGQKNAEGRLKHQDAILHRLLVLSFSLSFYPYHSAILIRTTYRSMEVKT